LDQIPQDGEATTCLNTRKEKKSGPVPLRRGGGRGNGEGVKTSTLGKKKGTQKKQAKKKESSRIREETGRGFTKEQLPRAKKNHKRRTLPKKSALSGNGGKKKGKFGMTRKEGKGNEEKKHWVP